MQMDWQVVKEYEDIQYFKADGIAKIVIKLRTDNGEGLEPL